MYADLKLLYPPETSFPSRVRPAAYVTENYAPSADFFGNPPNHTFTSAVSYRLIFWELNSSKNCMGWFLRIVRTPLGPKTLQRVARLPSLWSIGHSWAASFPILFCYQFWSSDIKYQCILMLNKVPQRKKHLSTRNFKNLFPRNWVPFSFY